ncbi:beta-glucosidase [Aestuariicella hydrocarbonica]|uniref:beta-glucosidase n=1 Tax=Pseudomaricurvus hydrocarbonicus TaxID=1470433 RepID=A0A9E5T3T3_9GAMM|nr:glycoside hydrolase family 3 N-terminal domain-containing protein [Aestuariicella hydrocarbonica]NHO67397.1 beta-glucosidase [Aestuariicella hydrocarbonica]
MRDIFQLSRRRFLQNSAIAAAFASGVSRVEAQQDIINDNFIDTLLAKMTLEEKAGQLHMEGVLTPRMVQPNFQKINPFTPNFTPAQAQKLLDEQQHRIRQGAIGFMTSPEDVDSVILAQKTAVEETRLKIPLLFGADIIHGHKTVFPVPIAEAASFEPDLARRTARAAAKEVTADQGIDMTYAPMVDIARDQRWGRVVEGSGEDVLLGSLFAEARVRGFQNDDPAAPDSLLACVKHFAAYGAAESGLDYAGNGLSERVLHEVYLPPFDAAFRAGAIVTMAAFNTNDGVPSTGDPHLLTEILRQRMGFNGAVLSDFQSEKELVNHGYAKDDRDAARMALTAGCDIGMVSGIYPQYLPDLVRSGELDVRYLDQAVRRVLYIKKQAGLFDDPFRRINKTTSTLAPMLKQHRQLARESAQKSVVMLKNEQSLLPLSKAGQRIALIGPFGEDTDNLDGAWSPFVPAIPSVSLVDGIKNVLSNTSDLTIVKGSEITTAIDGGIHAAVVAAQHSDVVILAIGEAATMSGESSSRTNIVIPEAQQALAEAVAATGTPVIVILRNGRALALKGAVRDANAILVGWYLGTATGPALTDILFGDVAPSGRLPMSFPLESGQQPYYYARELSGRPPAADSKQHFTSHFLDIPNQPLYPFGHGLSYSEIEYSTTHCNKNTITKGESLLVSCYLQNRGGRTVFETAQLYLHDNAASVVQPVRKMIDFTRVKLLPGEKKKIQFTVDSSALSFLDRNLTTRLEAGAFTVWIAPSATAGEPAQFELK